MSKDVKKMIEEVVSGQEVKKVLREGDESVDLDRLREIQEEIEGLVKEALNMIPRNSATRKRAESYWYPHMLQALGVESEYLGGSMHSLDDSIGELEEEQAGDFDDEDADFDTPKGRRAELTGSAGDDSAIGDFVVARVDNPQGTDPEFFSTNGTWSEDPKKARGFSEKSARKFIAQQEGTVSKKYWYDAVPADQLK